MTSTISRPLSCLLVLCLLAGCAVSFISPYDEVTDQSVSALQKKLSSFLTELERTAGTPDGAYALHKQTHEALQADAAAIRFRNDARPKNAQTQQQIQLLMENLQLFESAHAEGIAKEEVPVLRANLEQILRSILALELARKPGTG